MGTFHPNENEHGAAASDAAYEDIVMHSYENGLAPSTPPMRTSCFQSTNSLGNDYCPHASQLFTLMEVEGEDIPLQLPSLRKQTAVSCLASLVQSDGDSTRGPAINESVATSPFGVCVAEQVGLPADIDDDEQLLDEEGCWGQFAEQGVFDRAAASLRNSPRISRRHRSHLPQRRFPAKYGRPSSVASGSHNIAMRS